MAGLKLMIAAAAMALPAAAAAQYEAPANPPDPAAQLAEMVEIYDTVCLRAFPDDAAAARAVARYRAAPLSPADVRRFLHDDPGMGWEIAGRTGTMHLTIEQSPPYHSCALRAMTANGFADMGAYRSVANRHVRGGGYQEATPIDRVVRDLRIIGSGQQRIAPDGSGESLYVAITTPAGEARSGGRTAVEVRFAHQYYQAPVRR